MYIGDILGRRAMYSPDPLAPVDAGKDPCWKLTCRQLDERANRPATLVVVVMISAATAAAGWGLRWHCHAGAGLDG
jgi:hypothetical protein